MPISACVGRARWMDAWPASGGEAIHTQTFLGHPPACAAALASLAVLEEEKLVTRAAELGARVLVRLRARLAGRSEVAEVRGLGLLLAVECASPEIAARACQRSLESGVIVLPSGDDGRVLSITPPLNISEPVLEAALDVVAESLC